MANKSQSTFVLTALITVLFGCAKPPVETASLTVTHISSPSEAEKGEPHLFTNSDQVYLSWIERRGDTSAMKFSTLDELNWTPPKSIASGTTWFVNWADYPMMAINSDHLLAYYLEYHGDEPHAYDVKMLTSGNAGNTWSDPMLLHDDGKAAEHGFVSMIPYENNFMVCWLDGRNAAMEGDHHEGHHGSMTLRAAIVDGTGKKLQEWELDNRTCDCCQTSMIMTPKGPVVVYRDRSDEEVRDMSIVRFTGGAWTRPQSIFTDNWTIKGCPVNGPRTSSKGNTLAIAWYSVKDNEPNVKVVFSNDGGESFGEPVQINETPTIGRVDIELIDEQSAVVSWMEGRNIMATKVGVSGSKEQSVLVATSSSARSSGFPQLALLKKRAIFAWTDDSLKNVRTAFIDF